MDSERTVLVLAGDGVGPDVVAEAQRILAWFNDADALQLRIVEMQVGVRALEKEGTPLPRAVLDAAHGADAILFGCVGDPVLDSDPDRAMRPGEALLTLRRDLDLFANIRPVGVLRPLLPLSTLRPEVIEGADLVIVRELTGGLYYGRPRGFGELDDGERRATNTMTYSTGEIERVARAAFDLARRRSSRVCSVDKANVLEVSELWRETVQRLRDAAYPDIELSHMYVDNCAMQLIRNPRQFDVVLTENLFGDILSDCAAMISGSLGTLPSASIGLRGADGRRPALFEPVHGTAPDIAGKGVANPLGAILSLELLLRWALDLESQADELRAAVTSVLADGVLTADLAPRDGKPVSTRQMGDAVLRRLEDSRSGGR